MSYCFRIRFNLARARIDSTATELAIANGDENVALFAPHGTDSIRGAERLALVGRPYASEALALAAGARWRDVLAKALASLNIGADFGERAVTGVVTEAGLAALTEERGGRFVNDVHGLMAFECDPWPTFVSVSADAVAGRQEARVLDAIAKAAHIEAAVSDRERLAYDLYSASFFEASADARFMMLMMAVETLIELRARPSEVIAHVDQLLAATRAADIPKNEKESVEGASRWLRNQSIGQGGRELARQLGERRYMGTTRSGSFKVLRPAQCLGTRRPPAPTTG